VLQESEKRKMILSAVFAAQLQTANPTKEHNIIYLFIIDAYGLNANGSQHIYPIFANNIKVRTA